MPFGIAPIYWVLINSVVSFVYLFVISKILGKKQIAQLEFIDYAVGISLGSIAAEMATDSTKPFYFYIIAMSIFFALALFIALVGRKTSFLKRILKGKPAMLIYDGKIDYKQLRKSKIDVNDLLSMLREKDYFDIGGVAYAIFEPSGKLSVLPKGEQRPVVISDLQNKKVAPARLMNVLIADGSVSKSGLQEIGKDESWLYEKLNISRKSELKKIILATYDAKNDKIDVNFKENS